MMTEVNMYLTWLDDAKLEIVEVFLMKFVVIREITYVYGSTIFV